VTPAPPTTTPTTPTVPVGPFRCGRPDRRRVAVTFDDGPGTRFTRRLLRVLRQHRQRATFFVLGRLVKRYPELVREIAADGHLVANHSWDHPRGGTTAHWRQQILRTEEAIRAAGVTPARFFRPPHGRVTPQIRHVCQQLGYTIGLYTVLSSDWERPGAVELARQVAYRVAPGAIVVLHDAGGDRGQTLDALPLILRRLRQKDYALVGLDDLLDPPPEPGTVCARPGRDP